MLTPLPERDRPDGDPPVGLGADHPMRVVTREAAFDPSSWTADRKAEVAALFDGLAPEWNTRDFPGRDKPLHDAIERGGPFPTGPCVEVGAGTGLATPVIEAAFGPVLAVELSWEMSRLARAGLRLLADGSCLPVADGSVAAIVLQNMFLFPGEVDRVLRPDGVLVWVNSRGEDTPIHLPATDVQAALGDGWDGVASRAGWGTWAVFRRA